MTRRALVLAYDGARLAGWQSQPGHRTVQGEIEQALATLLSRRHVLHAAGRTDAGVHALAQVAHVDVAGEPRFALDSLAHRINGLVGSDIRVLGTTAMRSGFHARKSALGKIYRYRLDVSRIASPFRVHHAHHVRPGLDLEAMRDGARRFVGERDFASLQAVGSSAQTSVRRIVRCEVRGSPPTVDVVVEGTGFLRHMVRALAGSLLWVAEGRRAASWIDDMLAARSRDAAGPNAPARALFLERVLYAEDDRQALDACTDTQAAGALLEVAPTRGSGEPA